MTESGQEPPGTGRCAADVSGESEAQNEPKRGNRRRRKRRSAQGAQGDTSSQAQRSVAGPQPGEILAGLTLSGPVDKNDLAKGRPGQDGGPSSGPSKRRKKRRRPQDTPQEVPAGTGLHDGSTVGTPQSLAQKTGPDQATSPKGRKAANRRGRRRWQAGKGKPEEGAQPEGIDGVTAQGPEASLETANGMASGLAARLPRHHPEGGAGPGHRRVQGQRSRPFNGSAPLYAALDLGTNNCRLLIARPENRGFRVVDAYSRIVRLGEGVGSNRQLSAAAMERAIEALANCHKKLAERGVTKSRLIATEACRAAENGADFIDRVQAETGLALEIVNRETEARLAVAGCASLVDHNADGVILFDIGGGSSEIVWLDLRNRCGAKGYALTRFIRSWISLPVGVVNLAERHGGVHVTPEIFEAMVADAAGHLEGFGLADTLSEAISSGKVHMLGTSGTVTTLAGVHLGLRRYDRRRVDGAWLEDSDVSTMIDQLRDMPYEARVENPCIGEDRADLVLAGCAILEAIRRKWTCSRLRVADRGLREGILTELMAADGVWSQNRPGKRSSRRRQRNRA